MSQRLVLVDYDSGNLHSAAKALERAADRNTRVEVSRDPHAVATADRIVLPGVGAYGDCRAGLWAVEGMTEALETAVLNRAVPFLGICVGMQLMAERGLEHGEHMGFGWLQGEVRRIAPADLTLKVPHMGWNRLDLSQPEHPLFSGLEAESFVYFVHSYALQDAAPEQVLARTAYAQDLVAVAGRANWVGTQFHPEKSQAVGLKLLANFVQWRP